MGRWVVPFVLVAVGLVWIGQGFGLLASSSFMVGDIRWAIVGVILIAGGGWLAWRRRLRR